MDDDPRLSVLELIILSLTIYTVFSIIIQFIIPVSEEMMKLFNLFEWICSGFFLYEWFYRFFHSTNKKNFIWKNSIDFIASLPIGYLSGLKAFRLLKILQLVKIFGSVDRFIKYINSNRVYTFKVILFSTITLLTLISPIMILFFEEKSGNINNAEDAMWWTYCTLSTIGYGDKFPITSGGRLFTVFISFGGIGAFSIFSGLVVNYIIEKVKEGNDNEI